MGKARPGTPRPPRILMLSLNYAPEEIGIGPYSAGMAQMLAADGWQVDVVAGAPYYPQWQRQPGYAGWTSAAEQGVRVARVPHYVPQCPTGPRRLLHHASFAAAAAFPALKHALQRRPDVVFAVAPAMMAMPVAWAAARLSGAKLWLHVQDFEVETALATGLLGRPELDRKGLAGKGLVARAALGLEGVMLRGADMVSSISPNMCDRLAQKGVPPPRIMQLRNWANHEDSAAAADPDRLAREWGLQGKKIALYSGNIGRKQGLETIIDCARLLHGRTDLAFVICGNGPERSQLEIRAKGLRNIQFHPLQPASGVGDLLALADVHLLPQLADAADLVLPSKLANMLGSGRPVVAGAAPGTALADEVTGCGLVVVPEQAQAMADAIVRLCDDGALAATLGAAAKARAQDRWTKSAVMSGLAPRLHALSGRAWAVASAD
ncbi:WcaI family glycosyltransferase [Altererythrobacter confluentis]|uniref:WcaI family glycosyltransferase n=1 Tax=Allopontixanthobacter confluentis TaxID=1849021 RepID=A0A6L7GL39_9SPHN|nr:WcaI family glycosyltransferase [Allopontixanthobacter confluentis]MXP15381.1 WcaI family glycosyltransferase [Allopontixanthobacter confluentis]